MYKFFQGSFTKKTSKQKSQIDSSFTVVKKR